MEFNTSLDSLRKYISDNNLRAKYSKLNYDIEAEVYFLTEDEGGRSTPAVLGYSPNHLVSDNYLTSGKHIYLEQDYVFPGHSAKTGIIFITPEYYPNCLSVGMTINIQEASRIVGYASVTKIHNEVLRKER